MTLPMGRAESAGTPHLVMEMFTSMSGTTLRHIPYKGTAQALNDLISGTIPVMFSGLTGVPSLLSAGKVRALGISSRSRLNVLPSVPTIAEAGVPGFEAFGFVILAAPAGTPSSIVDRLHAETERIQPKSGCSGKIRQHRLSDRPIAAAGRARTISSKSRLACGPTLSPKPG